MSHNSISRIYVAIVISIQFLNILCYIIKILCHYHKQYTQNYLYLPGIFILLIGY